MSIEIETILVRAFEEGASRIHLNVGTPPQLVVRGQLIDAQNVIASPDPEDNNSGPPNYEGTRPVNDDDMVPLMKSVTPEGHQQKLQEAGYARFSFAYGPFGRVITSVFRQNGSLAMTMKLIKPQIMSLRDLGLENQNTMQLITGQKSGLIVAASPHGQGRSSIVAAILDHYNTSGRHIIATVEDPIEHIHVPQKAIIRQHEIGNDVEGFGTPVIKLGTPNIVYFGDDINTNPDIQYAVMNAINSGALVLTTYMGMTMDSGQIRDDIAEKIGKSLGSCERLAFFDSTYGAIAQRIDFSNSEKPLVYGTVSKPYNNEPKDHTYGRDMPDIPLVGRWAGPFPG